MKTISVKQVATALDITPRAVIYRLEKNQLRGTQSPNAFGKKEWRVYPTKEIVEGLKRNSGTVEQARKEAIDTSEFDFSPEDIEIVEASAIYEGSTEASAERNPDGSTEMPEEMVGSYREPADWQVMARETAKSMAEELVRPLGEIIKQQQERLAEQQEQLVQRDLLIEDKNRQLKLLPDFQKEAEQRRREAETKELEAIALAKQIEAMKELGREKALEAERLSKLETETLPSLERQLEQERLEKERTVAEALTQITALELSKREAEEARIKLEESLLLEIARLKEDKDEQSKAVQDKFLALTEKLDKLDKPWWKKLIGN
ncbi:MAG: hypothetical protein C0508_00485 [Cyanobacteria bacterium PR.023]|nr:hypothetical protein [Cyanobacteria bacterium PR.023]